MKSWTWLSNFPFTFHFHALEKETATHSSVLAWRIPGTREPGGLPSMGSHRAEHDWSDLAAAAAVYFWGLFALSPVFCDYSLAPRRLCTSFLYDLPLTVDLPCHRAGTRPFIRCCQIPCWTLPEWLCQIRLPHVEDSHGSTFLSWLSCVFEAKQHFLSL